MNELQVFKNEEFGQLRVIAKSDDEVYFNLHDIAWALGYTRPNAVGQMYLRKDRIINIIKNLDIVVVTASGHKSELASNMDFEQLYITESGLYGFLMESETELAMKFKKWIINEVLPSIRKHGAYLTPEKIEEVLLNPDTIIKLATQLKEERLKRLEAEKKVIALQPKAEMFDTFMTGKNAQTMNEVAKCLGIGRNKLFKFLRDLKILMSNNTPYECYRREGYFEVIETPIKMGDIVINKPQTLVTPKGVNFIAKLLKEKSITA